MNKPVITQAVINLYDEYTHQPLQRRDFIKRLAVLVGSSAAAYAVLPLLENNYANAAISEPDDKRLKTQMIEIETESGILKAYLAQPIKQKKKVGSVLIIHENRGLNAHTQDIARRVALAGFNALALDFLSPLGGTPSNEDEARALFAKLDPAQSIANGQSALQYLNKLPNSNGKLGVIGFCWGGGMAGQLAVHTPDLDAAISFYGMAPDLTLVPKIKAFVMLHYASEDERINAGRAAYESALSKDKIAFESYTYEGVQHAFNNDTNAARYNKPAADLAWQRSMDLFKRLL
ncbi:MAG: dienelactone hydrolase family protein [Arenimonas sp.]|nr:dienelactone hydrolase family protein [Arenimonas sp.]